MRLKTSNSIFRVFIRIRKWRVKVNAPKSVAKIFSNKTVCPDISLSLNVDDISWVTDYNYPGVYLDSKLKGDRLIFDAVVKITKAYCSLKIVLEFHRSLSFYYYIELLSDQLWSVGQLWSMGCLEICLWNPDSEHSNYPEHRNA